MEYLTRIWNILQVAFGLGFVIFLHELGHFLLAKWNDVKVEKFSIGFGPTLFGFTRGETEYVLAAVPLGGFVKMLGEGIEEGETKTSDPRAYPNKSVGARMAIISAGVIMNLILGLACFVYAYGHGMEEIPAHLGGVLAGSPAYEAGLRTGDEIVAIDGRKDVSFTNLMLKVQLSREGQSIRFDVKRPGHEGLISANIVPRREASRDAPTIGVLQSSSLELGDPPTERLPGNTGKELTSGDLKPEDTVVAAGPEGETPEPVATVQELNSVLARYRERPVQIVAQRSSENANSTPGPRPAERVSAILPPNHFISFGIRLTMEPIESIQGGSIAEKAGFRKGDVIKKVNDAEDFDPMTLPDLCYKHAGKPMAFVVERPSPGGLPAKAVELKVTPDDTPPWTEAIAEQSLTEPQEIPGLGLAYQVRNKVAAVEPGSPAASAGLKAGDVINMLTFTPVESAAMKKQKIKPTPIKFRFDGKEKNADWPATFAFLQLEAGTKYELTLNGSSQPLEITPQVDASWFHPLRGLRFVREFRKLPPLPASVALRRGFDDTVESVLGIYGMLRSLIFGRMSMKNFGGPVMIADMAYHAAKTGLTKLVHLLGLLSINLAVLNFLPIPPLDGGQMVFLMAEKVRGKPLPESALAYGTWAGLFLVLGLMLYVLVQDVLRLFF
ncbi:MAG: site-2 protease family protein [Isosphaeraceae bacterium]|nr:site-2 protease family protein [Isosphaeraceae bacterium]